MIKFGRLIVRAAASLILIAIGSYVISAQGVITGTWEASAAKIEQKKEKAIDARDEFKFDLDFEKGDLHISFKYSNEQGDSNNQGISFSYSDLEGLDRGQVEGVTQSMRFRLVRDAGTIDMSGSFENGKGSGTFSFAPDASFRSSMAGRGFEFTDRQMFAAATLDVTAALADDLRSSGFGNLDSDDLFKAKIFKIDSGFLRDMAATGYPNLEMEDLVKARIFRIDADFVRDVVAMGFQSKSFEELLKFRIFKITPEYLRDMQDAGFSTIDSEQAVKLRIFKVTPEFIREMQAEGLVNLTAEQAVKLRVFNVDGEFVRQARANGEPDLSPENLVKLKIHAKIR